MGHGPGKSHGQREPNRAPGGGFPELDDAGAAVKQAEIEREKNQHAKNETRPVPWRDFNETGHDFRRQTRAAVVFCIVTCEAPMAGRSPLCNHNTSALAM